MKKSDWLYPLTPERYAQIQQETEERLFAQCSENEEYLSLIHILCPQSAIWRRELAAIVKRLANEYVMDAVYIDQVAAANANLCCDPTHAHPSGNGDVYKRQLFVLGRAVTVAAPAGLVIWLLANLRVGDTQLLRLLADTLEPAGRFLGMDGVILLAFILGFPANEIVLPIMLMTYLSQGTLVEVQGLDSLRALLVANGWTLTTAACVALFSLFHWPCSTTTLTAVSYTHLDVYKRQVF